MGVEGKTYQQPPLEATRGASRRTRTGVRRPAEGIELTSDKGDWLPLGEEL